VKDSRRSYLQVKILLHLEEKPAKTITELTERLNAQRPSVSRSLKALKGQGIVYRDRQGWHISEAGKNEASLAKEKLEETRKMLNESALLATKILVPHSLEISAVADMMKPFEAIGKSVSLTAALANSSILNKIGDLGKLNSPFLSDEFYKGAIKPFLDIQEQNNQLLQVLVSSQISFAGESILNQNSQVMAKAIGSLIDIRHDVASQVIGKAISPDFSWLAKDMSQVTQAFTHVIHDQIKEISMPNFSTTIFQTPDRFSIPPAIMASYTDSARDFIDAEVVSENPILHVYNQSFEEYGDRELDERLYQLNPDYVEMRQGSWAALRQSNPDRIRHAATSHRELVRQLLQQLVPDADLPTENNQGTQLKARIKKALGTSEENAEFIDAVGKAVVTLYSQLNKYTHHNEKHEESLKALLHTGEGLIRFIFSLLD
jgi:DNA-binding transcriptional ArsR family regulator/ribosome-associated translation inhibitor RaiA